MVASSPASYDNDLIVIGGGSGGLAAAKKAIASGAKSVTLLDFVKPTEPHGIKWGLGGTCVNVGCIPKKLMHYAASMGPLLHHDAPRMGWSSASPVEHDWAVMGTTVRNYVRSLNFSYRSGLRNAGVKYINAAAYIEDPHTVSYTLSGKKVVMTTRNILIAVGGRPHVPNEDEVPGAKKYSITSDDLFWWPTPPGKTLVVGASYIALECAGFLTELGYDTTVAVRSILLRGFDRQCSEKVGSMMKELGTQFINAVPKKITKTAEGKLRVEFVEDAAPADEYDTILYATGRRPDTAGLNLEAVGVKMDADGKIVTNDRQQSSVSSIYVVGDALKGSPELTPVAIKTGEYLAMRLFNDKHQDLLMEWDLIPTTVFTPFEYGAVGLSEEQAIVSGGELKNFEDVTRLLHSNIQEKLYGEEEIEVFLYEFPTLELAAVHREKHAHAQADEYDKSLSANSLTKLVCRKSKNMQVIGFHFVGLNAGEMTQGYALALRLGATKDDFDKTVGIHPTDAEAFHGLTITRTSGDSWVASGGCGGGKCG